MKTVVYVANAGTREIIVMAMNRETGALTLMDRVPVPGSPHTNLTSLPMALSPCGRYLYAQLRGEPYPLSTFRVEQATGMLEHLAVTSLVEQMAYLSVDRTGRYLFGASYVGGKIAIYPIDEDGIVVNEPSQVLENRPKSHCVVIDGANKHVYAPVLEQDLVLEMTFDQRTGTFAPNGAGQVRTLSGAGPRHLVIHPDGKFAYLLTETSATIVAYGVRPGTGHLKELQVVGTDAYSGPVAASDIHVTPDGRFLYAAERMTSRLFGYRVAPDTGRLSRIGSFATERVPRGFAIDPRGQYLLAVGMESAAMTVYAIDQGTGELRSTARYAMGAQPNWIEILDLG